MVVKTNFCEPNFINTLTTKTNSEAVGGNQTNGDHGLVGTVSLIIPATTWVEIKTR